MALQPPTVLDRIFLQLRSKSDDKRLGAQLELGDLVLSSARGTSSFTLPETFKADWLYRAA